MTPTRRCSLDVEELLHARLDVVETGGLHDVVAEERAAILAVAQAHELAVLHDAREVPELYGVLDDHERVLVYDRRVREEADELLVAHLLVGRRDGHDLEGVIDAEGGRVGEHGKHVALDGPHLVLEAAPGGVLQHRRDALRREVDEGGVAGAPRERLEADAAGAAEEVQVPNGAVREAVDAQAREAREQRLAHLAHHRPQVHRRGVQAPAARGAPEDAQPRGVVHAQLMSAPLHHLTTRF
mmetsp:Transcript_6342/g.17796  ORF Transcript_6342/g.17796 Transcript_6342/m.17796 type:complete len:241 (+) Transcript_6342:250-972(+)